MAATRVKSQESITCVRDDIPDESTEVVLERPCISVTIWTDAGSADLHLNFAGGTCTTNHPKLAAGASYTYENDRDEIESFTIRGASASGKYNIIAH